MPTIPTNSLDSNITLKIARVFLEEFEKNRVATKTVNTTLLSPEFTPQFGDTIWFKRPHQYVAIETAGGDISSATFNAITSGKAAAIVQNYITVPISWTNREEALELDQLQEIIRPAAEECVTRFETNFQEYMIQNCGLSYGTLGTPLTKWGDVANFNALMMSIGVPQSGMRYALMNPFMTRNLADTQGGLASGNNSLVNTAWENAQISGNFGGLRGLMSNSMANYTTGITVDRAGTIDGPIDQTYLTAKDTMTQTITIDEMSTNGDIFVPGDIIEVPSVFRTNVKTREISFDQDGNPIPWRWTVVTGGTVAGNEVTLTVANAAIFETSGPGGGGQYNNVSGTIADGAAVTFLGASATPYQPTLFYHEMAFGVGTIKLPKLFTWDTVATTSDGISIRVTKYSDGDTNQQFIRFDMLPAFSTFNPLFAGTGWGE